ncbi:hypothetical protein C3495_04315 [Clostridiaceae bacterium 14S0207]|nr:hypothetical protein C3495_04315 [Clostridiaceae bacterium 14S0207]
MIIINKTIKVGEIEKNNVLKIENQWDAYKNSVFLDLEHYVYKKPKCIGVFGVCFYDEEQDSLIFTQFMIESKKDEDKILYKAYKYLKYCKMDLKKTNMVTFSGNNDYTVIDYLFEQRKIPMKVKTYFNEIDLQKCYEKVKKESIGLKNLEKLFDIEREGEVISGMNLAKTINKITKDEDYIHNMPIAKLQNILLYNEQDVVNLFKIYTNWNKYIK